jgi:glycosyltransferase involved in cell wall biosynthesis
MRICFVMPRNMSFSPATATSIDLCVRDLVQFSRFRDTTEVFGEPVAAPFADMRFQSVPRPASMSQARYARRLAMALRQRAPDVIVVEQHPGSAAIISRCLPDIPVVLHRHGMTQDYSSLWQRWRYGRLYGRAARIVCVSESLAAYVRGTFPALAQRIAVVPNGIDTRLWQPAAKEKLIAFAGRAVTEKGVLEMSGALARLLTRHPDWRATLLLAAAQRDAPVLASMKALLAPVMGAIAWHENAPLDQVRDVFGRAAIVLVPSIAREGFGRTALEAHAAGAALISSGAGALREVSGDAALYLDAVSEAAIESATERLIAAPAELARLQELSVSRARMHDIRACAAGFDALCESVLAERRGNA